jgi:hypothetical protein
MEKRLKKVQRGASVGFVLLKILRILLIIVAVAMIAGLVFLAVAIVFAYRSFYRMRIK